VLAFVETPIQRKREDIIGETKLLGIKVEVFRRDNEFAALIKLGLGLSGQQWRTGYTFVRTAVECVSRWTGLEIAAC
jgi:hypothetical protein